MHLAWGGLALHIDKIVLNVQPRALEVLSASHDGPPLAIDPQPIIALLFSGQKMRFPPLWNPLVAFCAGTVIGNHAVVEPGAVVTRNVPATAIVAGNPARIVRYVDAISAPVNPPPDGAFPRIVKTGVRGVTLHPLPLIEDLRGNLSFGEAKRHVPFEVKRYFLTFDVTTEEARGEHAHRTLEQFLICVHGRLHIVADDGQAREEFILDRPNLGLYLPPMVWGVQYRFSPGAVLLVLCSDVYEPADYIRDYADFRALAPHLASS